MADISCANCTNPNCVGLKRKEGMFYCPWRNGYVSQSVTRTVPSYSTSTTPRNTSTIKEKNNG